MRTHVPPLLMVPVLCLNLFVPAAPAQDVTAPANEDPGVIIGVVTDATNQRLPGVTLAVKTAAGLRSVVSDARGRYRIAGLPLGAHRVVANLPGFLLTAREVELTERYPEADASFLMYVGPLEETIRIPPPAQRFRVWPLGPESR